MRYRSVVLVIVSLALFSCKKEVKPTAPAVPPSQDPPVLLKDITIPHLPSPYYYFEYNTNGEVAFASFASGLTMYNVAYSQNRISEMQNDIFVNKDRLQYFYDNANRVSAVNYADSTGKVYKRIFFTYDGPKLIKLERERRSGGGFILEKTMTLTYYADGNLQELTEIRPKVSIPGQANANYTERFEQYDNKINVEGFSLIHNEFFDHLVLLPGVQLQKNNPGKFTHTGDDIHYQIDYTYTYNTRNAPLTKTGIGVWFNGPRAGEQFQSDAVFTYY